MGSETLKELIKEQLKLARAAAKVLEESATRAEAILQKKTDAEPSSRDQETLEALTARFSRLCDFMVQRLFRTLDEIELVYDGTMIDRLNRAEKRGIITSAALWRELRELRNEIAHEYLIEQTDHVVQDSLKYAATLTQALKQFELYIHKKHELK